MPVRGILWVPSFLLGGAAATALATGAGMLLYNDEGLLRAGIVLAAVDAGSFGAGMLAAASRGEERDPHAGRWWLGLLLALLGAASFAVAWEAMDAFAAAPMAQGVGLALTSALPAYCAAGTWTRLRRMEALVTEGTRRRSTLGAGAGVALGTVLVAVFLGRPVWAVTAFLAAMVVSSAGARLHVWILDRVPRLFRSVRDPDRPALRFEEWRTSVPESRTLLVRDGSVTRTLDPPPPGDWREGVATTLHEGHPVLFVGAGSWFDPADGRSWQVFEADEGVRKLAAEGIGWGDGALAGAPVPEAEGWVVVAEAVAAPLIRLSELRAAGVQRVWIGGVVGEVPEALPAAAHEAGHGVGRYRSAVAGLAGPPAVEARADELWCIDVNGAPPEAVVGMVGAPLPGRWAAGGADGSGAEPKPLAESPGSPEAAAGEVP